MRRRTLILVLLIAIVGPAGTPAQNQPDVEVVKFGWRKAPPISAGKDPLDARNAQIDAQIKMEQRKLKPDESLLIYLEGQKQGHVSPEVRKAADKPYEYQFRFKNKSSRDVKALAWSYVFSDAATHEELARRTFQSNARIAAGKERGLSANADAGPPMVVNAEAVKKDGKAWTETVVIEKVEYADGSKWERKQP